MAKDFLSDVNFQGAVTVTDTDAGSSAAPIIELYRNSSSPADSDYIGQLKFQGENDNDQKVVYAKITAKIGDATDTTEDGIIEVAHVKAGSNNISGRWTSDALKLINGTGLEIADGLLTLGSTAVTATAAELNILDGCLANSGGLNTLASITFGVVAANKAVTVNGDLDVGSFRNVTLTGILDAVNFKVNGAQGSDGQVLTSTGSGVAWEDASGGGSPGGSNSQVQFNNSGSFGGSANLTFDGTTLAANAFSGPLTGNVTGNVSGTAATVTGAAQSNITSVGTLATLNVTGAVTITGDGDVTVGVNGTSSDVKFYSDTLGSYLLWDNSEDRLDVVSSSGAAYYRSLNGTTTTYIGSDGSNTGLFGTSSAHRVRFITNDSERMTILSDGKVGIGKSDPATALDVVGKIDSTVNPPPIVETFASQSISASGTTVTFTSSRFASAPNVMVTQANSGGGGSKVPNVDNITASSCRVFLLNTSNSFVAGDASLLVTLEV